VKTYSHIRRALAGKLWFVHEAKMAELMAFFELKLSGGSAAPEVLAEIRAANAVRKARELELLSIQAQDRFDDAQEDSLGLQAARAKNVAGSSSGAVAVIPVYGMIMHRGGMMSDISGPSATSTESLLVQLRQAVNDPNVKAIVLDVDSPGGDVDGVDELATEIFSARKQKKITAVSNCLCASAAYYLASQASEMVVSPSSLTGSIGVYTMHEDDSELLANHGVKMTLIKFGENKAEGISTEPLSDAARTHLQEMVDTFGGMFEKAVARGRGIKQDDVHKKFGQGRVFDAKQAVRIGMADRIATLDDVLQGYGVSRHSSGPASASASPKISAGEPTDVTNDDECACDCAECVAGDCSACSHAGCDCDGCTCDMAAKSRKAKQSIERRRLELAAL
jgi:capsid assembly protease